MGPSRSRIPTVARLRKWLFAENAVYGKLLASSLVGVAAVGLLAASFVTVTLEAHRSDKERGKAVGVVRRTNSVENELARLEQDFRVYLVTRDPDIADRFHTRKEALDAEFDRLEEALGKRKQSGERLWDARKSAQHWLATVAFPGIAALQQGELVPDKDDSLLKRAREALWTLRREEEIDINSRQRLANQSFEVLANTPRLGETVGAMERAVWEYAETGHPEALKDYWNAKADFDSVYGHLSVLLDGRDAQLSRIREIHTGIERWRRETAEKAITERERGKDALGTLVRGDDRAVLIRNRIDAFGDFEVSQFDKANRRSEIVRALETTGFVAIAGLAILMLLGSSGYSFVAYRRHLRKVESAEAQTRSIIETTLDGVVTMDDQGIIRMMNPAAEKMFGYSTSELVGKSISSIIPQRLFLYDMSKVGRGTIMAMGQRQHYYPFPIEVSVSETSVEGHRQYVALIRDVTERKRSEETLRHIGLGISSATGEEFIRSLVVQLSKALRTDCAFILQISNRKGNAVHTLTMAENESIRTLPRYSVGGTACEEIVRRGFRAWSQDVRIAFPQDSLLEELNADGFVAMPLTDHHGRTIGVLSVVDRQPINDLQRVEATLRIFAARAAAEIERQQAQNELAAEKERLSVTLQSISEGCVTVDVEGVIGLLNPAAERLTGWTREYAVGRPLTEVFHLMQRVNRETCRPALEQLIRTGVAPFLGESCVLVAADGSERVVECSTAPIRDTANRRIGVVLFFRDMTERERTEEERRKSEKLESLGVAAGGIAHDFNNLLTVILGNISLAMMSQGAREALHERLSAAKNASVRAQDLAQQLLTFARGGAPLKKPESLAHLIRESVTFALRGTKVRCEFEFAEGLWPGDVDTGQISQALTNIALNADQAMHEGGTFHVSVSNFEQTEEAPSTIGLAPGRYSKVKLRDEGEGIPRQNLAKIFDPYFTTRDSGSGLGLATTYSIVKNHGGAITVESTVGRGTVFCIYLPVSDVPLREESPVERARPTGPGRVLVLDDEEVICDLVSSTLEAKGYSVTEAYDAETAIRFYKDALARKRRFDVVISDLTIPGGMGGQEAIKRLREIDPQVKAIVSSGYAMDPVMSRYREYGFCACLAKPYEVSALTKLVDEVFGGKPTAAFEGPSANSFA